MYPFCASRPLHPLRTNKPTQLIARPGIAFRLLVPCHNIVRDDQELEGELQQQDQLMKLEVGMVNELPDGLKGICSLDATICSGDSIYAPSAVHVQVLWTLSAVYSQPACNDCF